MEELTTRQRQVLAYIAAVIQKERRPPTIREIAAHFRWTSTNSTRQHLRLLRQKGAIEYDEGISRGIRLAGSISPAAVRNVPLIGKVAAGLPIEAVENIEGQIGIDANMFPDAETFALRVKGDSMIGIGIRSGDLAIIRKQAEAASNDIVIALLNGEATLKRYKRSGKKVLLHAENPEYADIEIKDGDDFRIVGVAVGIIRKF